MRLAAIILSGTMLSTSAMADAGSERLECSLVMPETVIDGESPAQDHSLLLVLKIKNISTASVTVCTYPNGLLELSTDGKEWQHLGWGSDRVLAPLTGNFHRLPPRAAAYVLIACHLRANAGGITLHGERNDGFFWATPPLKNGDYYLRCRYTYPDEIIAMMSETWSKHKEYPANYFPWKNCVEGVWLTNSVKFTIKNYAGAQLSSASEK